MRKKDQGCSNPNQTHLKSNVSMLTGCDIIPLVADTSSCNGHEFQSCWNFVRKKDQGCSNPTQTHLKSNVSMLTGCDIMPLVADTSSEVVGTSCIRKTRDAANPLGHI